MLYGVIIARIILVILVAGPCHMFCVNSLSFKHLFESF